MKNRIFGILILSCALLAGCVKAGDNEEIVLKSISFKSDSLKLSAGNTVQLTPVFFPTAFSSIAVDWKSSDESIAAVNSSGLLVTKKNGRAWIYVKDKNSATSGKCRIVVEE